MPSFFRSILKVLTCNWGASDMGAPMKEEGEAGRTPSVSAVRRHRTPQRSSNRQTSSLRAVDERRRHTEPIPRSIRRSGYDSHTHHAPSMEPQATDSSDVGQRLSPPRLTGLGSVEPPTAHLLPDHRSRGVRPINIHPNFSEYHASVRGMARGNGRTSEEGAVEVTRKAVEKKRPITPEWAGVQQTAKKMEGSGLGKSRGGRWNGNIVKGKEDQHEEQPNLRSRGGPISIGPERQASAHRDKFLTVARGVEKIMAGQRSPDASHEDNTMPALRELLIEGSTQPLRSILLRLVGVEAQCWLDAIQLVLDSDPSNTQGKRAWFLKALLHLSSNSQLYPEALQISHQVKKSDEPFDAGSFGEVYRGRVAERQVAVKVFKVYQNRDTNRARVMKAIRKETVLWCHLHHVNVLPCYGVHYLSSQSLQIGLVSPWMGSGNVERYLLENPNVNRLLLILDIASGMAYLHRNNIVHGDLKGANILVSTEGRACLADFGLSVLAGTALRGWTSAQTTSPKIAGTIRWQAPELLDADDERPDPEMSPESDVYSFACVCYEVMTGRIPFYHVGHIWSVPTQVVAGKRPTKPKQDEPAFTHYGLTEALWEFIEACWHKEARLRPTANQIQQNPLLSELVDPRPMQQWGGTSAADFRSRIVPPSYTHGHESIDFSGALDCLPVSPEESESPFRITGDSDQDQPFEQDNV